jgi:predicted nucleic acid-binding protein
MSLVLDSSVTLAWVYADETTSAVRDVFQLIKNGGAWAPSLWRLEVGNVLQMGIRRGRHDLVFLQAALADLSLFPISIDPDTDKQAWATTLHLAHRHRLTLYDAAYLELAHRRSLPLATLDADLHAAAMAEEVPLLGI